MSYARESHAVQRRESQRAPDGDRSSMLPLGHPRHSSGGAPPPDYRPAAERISPGQIQRAAREGLASPTIALPHRERLASVLGEEAVAGVKAHVDPGSTGAMQAQAYATGEHVVFGEAAPSVALAAHEVAHVVQQRQGISLPGGVGLVGDTHEQQADAVAGAVVRGDASAVPAALRAAPAGGGGVASVQRKAKDEGYAPVGATGEAAEFVEDSKTAVRTRRGQRGYASYAIADASRASEAAAATGQVHEYARLTPWTADLERDQQHRLNEQAKLGPESEERSAWSVGGLDHELSQRAASAAQEGAADIARVIERHLDTFQKYNDWASVADGFNVALYQLSELMEIFGADSEVAFLAALEREIGVATQVKMTAQYAAGAMPDVEVPDFDVPTDDGRFQTAAGALSTSFEKLQAAHKGWRVHQIKAESAKVDGAIAGVMGEQAEIESTIAFVKSLGATLDTTAGMVAKANGLITTGQAQIAKGTAVFNTWRNRSLLLQGEDGTYNTEYVTFDASGNPEIKNHQLRVSSTASVSEGAVTVETRTDDVDKDVPALGNLPDLPSGAGDFFGKAAELVYEEDILRCKAELKKLESHKKILGQMIDLNAYEQAALELMAAMSDVLDQFNEFRDLAQERHRAFIKFGRQIDDFASSGQLERAALKRFEAGHRRLIDNEVSAERLDAHLAGASAEFDTARSGEVAPLDERFAAVLGVASVVQQAVHAGSMAESLRLGKGLTTEGLSQLYRAHHICREPTDGYEHLMKPLTASKTELARLESLHGNVRQFEQTWQTWGPGLGRVSTALNSIVGVEGGAMRAPTSSGGQSDEG